MTKADPLIKVLVVDDEPLARRRLLRLLASEPGVEVTGSGANGTEAVSLCCRLKPDVILMDIQMPVLDGLRAARRISAQADPPAIVFCTAFEQYALDAFRVHAVDYLVKPVRAEHLHKALTAARRVTQAQLRQVEQTLAASRHLNISRDGNLEKLAIDDICFFRRHGKHVAAHTVSAPVVVDYSLKELQASYPDQFVRLHRNSLVAHARVQRAYRDENGRYWVEVAGVDQALPVSRRHSATVKQLFDA